MARGRDSGREGAIQYPPALGVKGYKYQCQYRLGRPGAVINDDVEIRRTVFPYFLSYSLYLSRVDR